MASHVSTILQAIVDAWATRAADGDTYSDVPVLIGKAATLYNDTPPRVVLYPGHETYRAPRTKATDDLARNTWTRDCVITANLWGTTGDEVEDLIEIVLEIVHALVGPTGYANVEGQWLEGDDQSTDGEGYDLTLTLTGIPVLPSSRPTTAPITSVTLTPTMEAQDL